MAASQPTYPTSYPNSQTTSNPCSHTNHHDQPSQPMYDQNLPFLRRLILVLILLFILITAISFISWLILHPQVPIVRVDSLSVSNFNLSDLQTTARYEVQFTVTNPNTKINLQFEGFRVSVSYKRSRLSRGWIGGLLEVRKMNETGLKIELGSNSGDNCWIASRTTTEMGSEYRERREVSLNVGMAGLAKLKVSDWLGRQRSISVFCDNLEVAFSSDNDTSLVTGKLKSTETKNYCSVYFL